MSSELVKRAAGIAAPLPLEKVKKKGKRVRRVLSEEAYVSALEQIIRRDYFPNLSELTAQQQYLEALEKNDLETMRKIEFKYPTVATLTPGGNVTPRTPSVPTTPSQQKAAIPGMPVDLPSKPPAEAVKLTLDDFLTRYTSEDNDSFETIVEETNSRVRQRYAEMFPSRDPVHSLALTNGEKVDGQTYRIETWKHTPRNALMYGPEAVGLSPAEALEMSKRPVNVVNRGGTRFKHEPFPVTRTAASERSAIIANSNPFSIQAPSPRETLGREMVEKRAKRHTSTSSRRSTPLARGGTPQQQRQLRSMSPAAQRLLRQVSGRSPATSGIGVDSELRRSYATPSPHRRRGHRSTPRVTPRATPLSTPQAATPAKAATPRSEIWVDSDTSTASGTASQPTDSANASSLTDNLL
eukprot:m.248120 g.248120  ORF g.248120 m.248120 type:complete len:410 (-) comp15407_c2_seq1:989-2218(-)